MGISDLDKLKDKEKIAVFQQRIQFQNETIESQKNQIAEIKAENERLKEQIEKFSKSIQDQTGVIADQQRTLKDQETTILQQQMSISELQKRLIELEKTLESTSRQIVGVDERIQEETKQMKSEIVALKKELEEKQAEFNEKITEREDIIMALREENANLEKGVKELSQIKLSAPSGDSSASTQQISELETSLKSADDTISNLEQELENQKRLMQSELNVRDVKIAEYERLMKKQGVAVPTAKNFVSERDTASVTIADIFSRTKSNSMVFLPDINAVEKLDFEALRPTTRVQLAVPLFKGSQIIEQVKTKPNIEIRNYEGNIWGIIRDNEEMLLAPISETNEPTGLVMKGDAQIEAFGTVMRSNWSRLRRI
ncbi:MAG: hypothetical protein HWN65_11030 [Candidatus Helarchaeota archaeon]|nr:hypothetical protein [Candidatus Helarchaeota archaeon]